MTQQFLFQDNTIIITDIRKLPKVLHEHSWASILDLRPSLERQQVHIKNENLTHLPILPHTLSEQDIDIARGIWSREKGYHLIFSSTTEMPRCLTACHLGRTHQWDFKKLEQKISCDFPRPASQFLRNYLNRYLKEAL